MGNFNFFLCNGFQGIIQPHSVKEVPLHITAECLEEVTTMAYFMIFGSSDAPLVSLMTMKFKSKEVDLNQNGQSCC